MITLSKRAGEKIAVSRIYVPIIKGCFAILLPLLAICQPLTAQTNGVEVVVPDWALPGSAIHKQGPPPADFHCPTQTIKNESAFFKGKAKLVVHWYQVHRATIKTQDVILLILQGYKIGTTVTSSGFYALLSEKNKIRHKALCNA